MNEPTPPPGFYKGGRGGQHWYRIGGGRTSYAWRICDGCGELRLIKYSNGRFCSRRCILTGKSGADARYWLGGEAGYVAMHGRVYRTRGKATECLWGCQATRYDWASLTGNYGDVWDYAQMCRGCHKRYDGALWMMDPARDHRRWKPNATQGTRRTPTPRLRPDSRS